MVVALDNDPAGRRAATAAHDLLLAAGVTNARVPNLPAGQDPADVLADAGAQALAAALGQRRPLADLAVDQVLTATLRGDHTPESRLWALDKTAQVIARMPSEQRARQAVRTARVLGLDAFRVLDTVQSPCPTTPPARPAGPAHTTARCGNNSGHSSSPATPPGSTRWTPPTGTPAATPPRE